MKGASKGGYGGDHPPTAKVSMPEVDGVKLAIVCSGSRGDIQPFLGSGLALMDAGFKVSLITGSEHEALVKSVPGLEYYSNGCSFEEFFAGPATEEIFSKGEFFNYIGVRGDWRESTAAAEMTEIVKAIEAIKPDFVLTTGPMHEEMTSWVPKIFGIPALQTMLMPMHGIGEYKPLSWLPDHASGSNRQWNYDFMTLRMTWIDWYAPAVEKQTGKKKEDWAPATCDWALSFGLDGFGPKQADAPPILIMAPEEYTKKPEDPASMVYTGYPHMPTKLSDSKGPWGGEDTEKLEAFLTAGDKPVYIGFGSMKCMAPEKMTKLVVKALKLAQQRGVVLGGWGGLDASKIDDSEINVGDEVEVKATGEQAAVSMKYGNAHNVAGNYYVAEELKSEGCFLKEYAAKNIMFVTAANHEVLFSKCSVLVHHSGDGTTFTAMKSGTPSIVTPIHMDQIDNGTLIATAGGGTVMAHLSGLTPEALSAEIKKVLGDADMKAKAAEIGKVLSAQDGSKKFADEVVKFYKEMVVTGEFMKKVEAKIWVGNAPEPEKAKEAGAPEPEKAKEGPQYNGPVGTWSMRNVCTMPQFQEETTAEVTIGGGGTVTWKETCGGFAIQSSSHGSYSGFVSEDNTGNLTFEMKGEWESYGFCTKKKSGDVKVTGHFSKEGLHIQAPLFDPSNVDRRGEPGRGGERLLIGDSTARMKKKGD